MLFNWNDNESFRSKAIKAIDLDTPSGVALSSTPKPYVPIVGNLALLACRLTLLSHRRYRQDGKRVTFNRSIAQRTQGITSTRAPSTTTPSIQPLSTASAIANATAQKPRSIVCASRFAAMSQTILAACYNRMRHYQTRS
jgi:hypothetical protein